MSAEHVIRQSSKLDDGVGGGHLVFVTQIPSMYILVEEAEGYTYSYYMPGYCGPMIGTGEEIELKQIGNDDQTCYDD